MVYHTRFFIFKTKYYKNNLQTFAYSLGYLRVFDFQIVTHNFNKNIYLTIF